MIALQTLWNEQNNNKDQQKWVWIKGTHIYTLYLNFVLDSQAHKQTNETTMYFFFPLSYTNKIICNKNETYFILYSCNKQL